LYIRKFELGQEEKPFCYMTDALRTMMSYWNSSVMTACSVSLTARRIYQWKKTQ